MATARSTNRTNTGKSQRTASAGGRTTSRTGAWEQVKKHPIIATAATAGVLAMGVGAYALLRKNGHSGRRGSNA